MAFINGCASLPDRPETPPQSAIAPGTDAPLDRAVAAAEARHAGQAGFRLVVEGTEAFVTRVKSARSAARSLDVQTYIWHAMTRELSRATRCSRPRRSRRARCGCSSTTWTRAPKTTGSQHSTRTRTSKCGCSIRSRPAAARFGWWSRPGQFRPHQSPHAQQDLDRRTTGIAIVGGRNLGDEYFGASEGGQLRRPRLRDGRADRARRVRVVRPLLEFGRATRSKCCDARGGHANPRSKSCASAGCRDRDTQRSPYRRRTARGRRGSVAWWRATGRMQWTAKYRFVSDDPLRSRCRRGSGSHAAVCCGRARQSARRKTVSRSSRRTSCPASRHELLVNLARPAARRARADEFAGRQ